MPRCDSCGNDYDKAFVVETNEGRYTFDSFECAAHKLAPQCSACGCRILGHGVESRNAIYCCAHCAESQGEDGLADRQ